MEVELRLVLLQLAQHAVDRAVGRGRDQGEREARVDLLLAVRVEIRAKLGGIEAHPPVRGERERVHELHRRGAREVHGDDPVTLQASEVGAAGEGHTDAGERPRPERRFAAVEEAPVDPRGVGELAEDRGVRPALADRGNHGGRVMNRVRAVGV